MAQRKPQVIQSSAAAHHKLTVVGIDYRQPSGAIGVDLNGIAVDMEQPRLAVVAARRQHRIAQHEPQHVPLLPAAGKSASSTSHIRS